MPQRFLAQLEQIVTARIHVTVPSDKMGLRTLCSFVLVLIIIPCNRKLFAYCIDDGL